MRLGSFNNTANHYECLRALTPEELEKHLGFLPSLTEARDRLALFRMLDRNYDEWRNYLDRLLSATFKEEVDVSEELNRLLLNYLTFAYTIQEHFSVSLRQRFKKEPGKLAEYSGFIDRLCAASWAFAFILDYRGYVQHVDLGVDRNHRTADRKSVRVEVVAQAKTLLKGRRGWTRSRLTAEAGEIDLIEILKEFHHHMLTSYATFVVKFFFPELLPAAEFYSELTKEVHARDPIARMIFFTKEPESTTDESGKVSVSMSAIFAPNDLLKEFDVRSPSRL